MNGWQEPKDGKRIYIITDNTRMDGFTDHIKEADIERLYVLSDTEIPADIVEGKSRYSLLSKQSVHFKFGWNLQNKVY